MTDRQEGEVAQAKAVRLKDKIASLKQHDAAAQADGSRGVGCTGSADFHWTDPDARSMATSGKGTGVIGYNVQAAVDTKNHPDRGT